MNDKSLADARLEAAINAGFLDASMAYARRKLAIQSSENKLHFGLTVSKSEIDSITDELERIENLKAIAIESDDTEVLHELALIEKEATTLLKTMLIRISSIYEFIMNCHDPMLLTKLVSSKQKNEMHRQFIYCIGTRVTAQPVYAIIKPYSLLLTQSQTAPTPPPFALSFTQ